MSAYVVSRKHILYMVNCHNRFASTSIFGNQAKSPERLAEIANMLWQENIKSVQHRYPDCDELPGPIGEDFKILPEEFLTFKNPKPMDSNDLAQLAKTICCYEYQSCEHDEWNGSDAFIFCQGLKDDILRSFPGYDQAVWGAPNE